MLGHSLEPGRVRERAQWAVEQGYKAQKWFFRYGPADGLEGMEKNVALVRTVREAVGPNIEIMLDCLDGLGRDLHDPACWSGSSEYHPRWIEESVPPDRIDDFAAIRRSHAACRSRPASTSTPAGASSSCSRPTRST